MQLSRSPVATNWRRCSRQVGRRLGCLSAKQDDKAGQLPDPLTDEAMWLADTKSPSWLELLLNDELR